ncbi:hypothetical protein GLP31_13450 [Photobacterium carnosum]|uniref:hypothetical protein n=1 Tax=Photobacterium carnosum TaxID=2023717 RepID=UPI001E45AB6D|nr:hypothetical protein [Photobacterium carnosum]MCD9553487.1 hypothetical protein [Photobacterium carnosum]
MYEKFVAKDKDVFATPFFIMSTTVPLIAAVCIGLLIHQYPFFAEFLSTIWATMKLPIAIASLAIPFGAWAIANHRSSQVNHANKLLESKRLVETYLEQERFFEKVYGRKITTANWQFITAEDLPVIHSELYEFQRLQEKGQITPKDGIENNILDYFNGTRRCFEDFYIFFNKEKNNANNAYALESLTTQLFTYLHGLLSKLSNDLGTKNVDLNQTKLGVYITAYFEIYRLCVDLKLLPANSITEDVLSEDYETFNAVVNVISKRFNNGYEDTNLESFTKDRKLERMVKHSVAEPHIQHINDTIIDWSTSFTNHIESMKSFPFDEDAYIGMKLFTDQPDNAVLMRFVETTETEYFGELRLEKDDDIIFMPIFKDDTKLTIHRNNQAAEEVMTEMVKFLSKHLPLH